MRFRCFLKENIDCRIATTYLLRFVFILIWQITLTPLWDMILMLESMVIPKLSKCFLIFSSVKILTILNSLPIGANISGIFFSLLVRLSYSISNQIWNFIHIYAMILQLSKKMSITFEKKYEKNFTFLFQLIYFGFGV